MRRKKRRASDQLPEEVFAAVNDARGWWSTPAAFRLEPLVHAREHMAADSGGASIDQLIAALRQAHDRICDRLAATARAALSGDGRAATLTYNAFVDALQRHISVEERHLLPVLDELGASTAPLRAQHRELQLLLGQARAQLTVGDGQEFSEIAQELLYALYAHCVREQRQLQLCVERLERIDPDRLANLQQRLAADG